MQASVGTSGFSYPGWKGIFYPPKHKPADMLSYYAQRLGTVELNNSFYRLPTREAFEGWATQTPHGFTFAVKAPQRITHHKRLVDVGEAVTEFFERASGLGSRLGPLLFQMPPNLRADQPRLEAFLATLPQTRVALEFRHVSWFTDETYGKLEARGVALVGGDLDEEGHDPPFVRTAPFVYLRLRRPGYDPAALESWAERIHALGVEDVFVYFKHESEGPGYAAALQSQLDG